MMRSSRRVEEGGQKVHERVVGDVAGRHRNTISGRV